MVRESEVDPMRLNYETYCNQMKERGHKPMLKLDFEKMMGINQPDPVFVSRSTSSSKQMSPTMVNHEKKIYAPKISRKGWTKEQIATRRAENVIRSRKKKKLSEVIS